MNVAALDLNLLVAFEALLVERSVSRAANRIGLSQPGMSNALARLRNVFDDRLFVRNGQTLLPTAKAVELAAPICEALNLIRNAVSDRTEFEPARAQTRFRILASDYCEMALVAPLVAKLRPVAPGICVLVRRSTHLFALPVDELKADTADVAIGFFPELLPPGSGLAQVTLSEERLVALTAGHVFPMASLSLKTFLRAPQIRVSLSGDIPGLMDEVLAKKGHRRNAPVCCSGFLSVPWFVVQSDLVGIVPEKWAAVIARPLGLQIRKLPVALPRLRLSAVWHERNTSHPAHQWLRSELVQVGHAKNQGVASGHKRSRNTAH